MERLKRVIRQALSEQAHRIKLQVGTEFEILAQQGIRMMPEGPLIDEAYLEYLYAQLLPHDAEDIAQKKIVQGLITIPQVGKIQLIAAPFPPASLRLYLPPRGAEMFAGDLERLKVHMAQMSPSPPSPPMALKGSVPAENIKGIRILEQHNRQNHLNTQPLPSPPVSRPPLPHIEKSGFSLDYADGEEESQPTNQAGPDVAPKSVTITNTSMFDLGKNSSDFSQTPAPPAQPNLKFSINTGQEFDFGSSLAEVVNSGTKSTSFEVKSEPLTPPDHLSIDFGEFQNSTAKKAPHEPIKTETFSQTNSELNVQIREAEQWEHQGDHQAEDPFYSPSDKILYGPDEDAPENNHSDRPIDRILKEMIQRKASDLHLTCNQPICFRIDGDIQRVGTTPVTPADMEQLIDPILPLKNLKEFLKINDTDFAYELAHIGRFRVNIFRDKNGVGCVIRHIPSKILTSEQLNLPPIITKFCQLTKGLVVVTGPTGSGKSTTLAAMIDWINKNRSEHILTIEDPVEFVHPQQNCLVNQREVHRHTTSFSRALKAALREDPDIILIGEMRDLETIAIAIETAETGHLVFGTLHTTTAVSTVDRIIDQFPSDRQAQIRTMLSSSLKGVVAQTLLKKKGSGRVAAHEILVINDAVSAMIREGKIHMVANHMQTQKADGNVLLNESLFKLVKDQVIDVEEAIRKSVDKTSFLEVLKRNNLLPQNGPGSSTQNPVSKPGQVTPKSA